MGLRLRRSRRWVHLALALIMFVEPAYGRLRITHLADQDDIGILPDRRVNSRREAVGVGAVTICTARWDPWSVTTLTI
jgi:hypothetical protein